MKKLLIISIILISWILINSSCRSSKIQKTTKDSSSVIYKDSSTLKLKDSIVLVVKDSSSKKETIDDDEYGIYFDTDDTIKATGIITIKNDSNKLSIDPGGRKIKYIKSKSLTTKKDSTGTSSSYSSVKKGIDISSNKSFAKTDVKLHEEVISKKGKSAIGYVLSLWWLWLLIILYFLYRYLKSNYTLPFKLPF